MNLVNKKELIAIDNFRVLFAIGVVAIHIDVFSDVNGLLRYNFIDIFCRVCVPFFFITSGFFIQNKLHDKERIKKYIVKNLKLYLFYNLFILKNTILYIVSSENPVKELVIEIVIFILKGEYQLWFFISLIVAVSILYIIKNKTNFKDKELIIIFIIIYILGTLTNAYLPKSVIELINNNSISGFFYNTIYACGRNGVTFGLPYVFAGYYIANNKNAINIKHIYKLLFLFTFLMFVEGNLIYKYINTSGQDMLIMLAPVSVLLFLVILSIDINEKYKELGFVFRRVSVIIFGLHLYVLPKIAKYASLFALPYTVSLLIVTVTGTILIGLIIIGVSKIKLFNIIDKIFW